jgi:hypothetical protein
MSEETTSVTNEKIKKYLQIETQKFLDKVSVVFPNMTNWPEFELRINVEQTDKIMDIKVSLY